MQFNRQKFFKGIRHVDGISPTGDGRMIQSQVDGLNFLLNCIEDGGHFQTISQVAYFLATVAHECRIPKDIPSLGKTWISVFQPVTETGNSQYFTKYDHRKDLGNTYSGDGEKFKGRGYVQNTGRTNARKAGDALSGFFITREQASENLLSYAAFERIVSKRTPDKIIIDQGTFLAEPDLLLIPRISYMDSVDGMFTGRYTGKKITDYINQSKTDYYNARRVINSVDRAGSIALVAEQIEQVLAVALENDSTLVDIGTEDTQTVAIPTARLTLPVVDKPLFTPPTTEGVNPSLQPSVNSPSSSTVVPVPGVQHSTIVQPVEDPFDIPVKVLGSLKDKIVGAAGWLTGSGAAALALLKDNLDMKVLIFLGVLAAVVIIMSFIYTIMISKAKIETASRPDRYTVK
jgi:putative chitinase